MRRKLRMLIVEDEESVCLTYKLIFEKEGYQVVETRSCAGALVWLQKSKFDIVMTDLSMERGDSGFDVVRAAQELDPRPVIIVCTGYANAANAQKALLLRIDHFAIKPVDLEEFMPSVRRLVRLRQIKLLR